MSFLKYNDSSYETSILMAIASAGIMIKIFLKQIPTSDGFTGPANAVLWGYGTIILSLFGIMFISFSLANKTINADNIKNNIFNIFKIIISTLFPVILLIGILLWVIIINIQFYTKINKGLISKTYGDFNSVLTILILIQLVLVFKYILNKIAYIKSTMNANIIEESKLDAFTTQISYISYIMGLFNIIFIGSMHIILEYYSTDG